MSQLALIIDLDNTLYSWMDSFAPALQSTINYLAKELHQPVLVIRDSFKRVFNKHKSVEVVNSVKELDIWEILTLSGKMQDDIQEYAQTLFFDEFKNKLRLFPDIERVLLWAKERGMLIIAFSDARAFWADFRLSTLNLYSFFDSIYVLKDEVLPEFPQKRYPDSVIQYSQNQCKPSDAIYLEILFKTRMLSDQLFVVGDSKKKDILPASKLDIHTIWAKYGNNCLASSKRLLGLVTPWTASQRAGGGRIKSEYTIESFSEIINIIETNTKEAK